VFRNPLIDAAVVLIAVLLIFGPKRLPMVGRGLGQGMREFKEGITGKAGGEDDERPALAKGEAADATAPPAERDTADVGSTERSS
jgi:sec-independent protein translocase protein TatA